MYSYLKGVISIVASNAITLEVRDVGFQIFVSNPYSYELNEELIIFVQQVVKEDENSLYGFKTKEEKNLFNDLISVKGIGPKTALAILGSATVGEIIQSIKSEDHNYLQKFPKIGKKAASQIILDLTSKYTDIELTQTTKETKRSSDEDVLNALLALGYKQKDILKYLKDIDPKLTTEERIKRVLHRFVTS